MRVRKIDTDKRRDVRQFIQVPLDLYKDCPQWVPPILPEMKAVLNRRKYPFYRHSDADFFVAEQDGQTVGRIAVVDNRKYNEHHGRKESFFYYFDAVDDVAVARGLFDAAFEWARGRGLDSMVGPKGFLQGDGMGALVEGFEHRPAVGVPYNHAYYDDLITASGFQKETDFFSGYLSGDHELGARIHEIAERVKERRGYHIKSFSSIKELREWVPRIGKVYNDSFADNWEFCPVTEEEMEVIADRLVSIAHPKTIKLVMKGDQPIGFVFAFFDISEAIQKTKGRVWPFGWIRLMREFKRTEWVNLNGTGLMPEYQGLGGNAILYTELAKSVREFGFKHADVVQVEEKNAKSLGDMAAIGVQWYKTHRLYRRAL